MAAGGDLADADLRPDCCDWRASAFIATKDALAPVPLAGAYATLAIIAFVGIVPLAAVRTPLPKVLVNRRGDRFASIAALRRRPIRLAVGIAAVSQGL